jgi:regulator of sirC expression with transglutaminase-like and TPR domain
VPAKGQPQLIDVYEGGKALSRKAAKEIAQTYTGEQPGDAELRPVSKKAILIRMLHNLLGLARGNDDIHGVLRYLDAIVAIAPEAAQERLLRAVARLEAGNRLGAREDVDWLLRNEPEGINRERVLELRRFLTQPER